VPTHEIQSDQLGDLRAAATERIRGGLRRVGRGLAIITGPSTGTWLAYHIDPRLGVIVTVLSALVVPLVSAVSNPKLIVDWLDEAAAVPPAVTRLLISVECERRRWRELRGGGRSA